MSLLAPLLLNALTPLQMVVICGVSFIAAISDIRSRRIPNWLTFPMLATGLAWSTWMRGPLGFLDGLAAALLLAAPYVILFVFAGGGGGDVKLMAGIGAWTGLTAGLFVLLMVALAGVIIGLIYARARGQFRATIQRIAGVTYQLIPATQGQIAATVGKALDLDKKQLQPMPYGVAIFAGVCLATGGVLLWHA